jgi:hypothetical protein
MRSTTRITVLATLAAVMATSTWAQSVEDSTNLASTKPPQRDLSEAKTRIILAHMIFMILAWLLLAPLAILIARFGRTTFKWYPHHRNIQIATMLFFIVGFGLGVGAAYPDAVNSKKHYQVGVAIFVIFFFQMSFGLISHRITGRWVGYLHAATGLTLFGLAIWNIITGFNIWQWKAGNAPKIFVYAWMGFLIALYLAGFAFLPREIKQHKEKKEQRLLDGEKSSDRRVSSIDSTDVETGQMPLTSSDL